MFDFQLGSYPPMCPRSIMLEKQLKHVLEGKTIINASWEKYYTGKYSWHGDDVPGLDKIINSKILFADASNILTDNGMLIFFSYTDGGLRYFVKDMPINMPKARKSVSHGYHLLITLDDGSSIGINLYGWGTILKISEVDLGSVNLQYTEKSRRYPFIPKSPIDVTDDENFTYERFREWLIGKPDVNIVECCSTVKGAFRIDNPVMNYILLISKVHPLIKARSLTESEVRSIYDNTAKIIRDYKSGLRVCECTDIFGNAVEAKNDVLWMTSRVLDTPCPVCGTLLKAKSAAGTKMYFCPDCQVFRK